ncbi:cupin domain-containing protein [Sphingomonas sp. AOB5]|uniref:cupin domain-containing protein n=1 Tax=Sphingomonas sp. AOB5 TaxID=3034017 RepID=UPI0023F91CB2|nr:cupin domain-containing protein [Sphingomonas sp. AOB5]MDF7776301.1 cupin domain-containing protein [Sphingomonas sp. AOB5]
MKLAWAVPLMLLGAMPAAAQSDPDRKVDPTFLHRFVPDVAVKTVPISSASAKYRPLFGEGDDNSQILRGVTRFGQLSVDAGGRSSKVSYAREEHMLVILSGSGTVSYGGKDYPVKANDFMYLPPTVEFGLNGGKEPVTAILMGFAIPEGMKLTVPDTLKLDNIDNVPLVTVGSHPVSTLYRLLMGDTTSTRDRLSTGHVMISLFVMEFQPGGTNFPHHHETQEEIYILLDGTGEMVAGSGMNGIEGKYPAKPGDAYFYRANATVGFYNDATPGKKPARILAVRSNLPPRK